MSPVAANRSATARPMPFDAPVLEIVRAGLGVSILPSAGLLELPDGVVVRPLVPKTVRRLGIAVSASASAAARSFLDQIAALDLH
jgi:DNA-binding transcriptional LysR family regulator